MPAKEPTNWDALLKTAEEATGGYAPLDPDEYDLVITQATTGESSTGKDQFRTRSRVVTGEKKGRIVFNTFTISPESPQALGIFFRQMALLGLDKAFFSANGNEEIAAALVGKAYKGVLVISDRTDKNGNKVNDVKTILSPSEEGEAAAADWIANNVEGERKSGGSNNTGTAPSGNPTPPRPASSGSSSGLTPPARPATPTPNPGGGSTPTTPAVPPTPPEPQF